MEIKITIEGLDQLTEAIALLGSAMAYKQGTLKIAGAAEALAENVTEKAEEVTKSEEKVTEEPEKVSNDIPMEDVRQLVVSSKANKEKAKMVMTEMGVKKLTDLNQEQLNELYAALRGE